MRNINMKKNLGFTLAEILIAMTVIGIIASLTIPALIKNIQDAELKTAWREAFSSFSQTITLVRKDNLGEIKGVATNNSIFKDKLLPYLKYTAHVNQNGSPSYVPSSYTELNGVTTFNLVNSASILLTNGMIIYVPTYYTNCDDVDGTYITNRCSTVKIDVNGIKGPNVQGRDLFSLMIFNNRVLPAGCSGVQDCNDYWSPSRSCNPGSSDAQNKGLGCSAKYLLGN